jgi:hypothetical protein
MSSFPLISHHLFVAAAKSKPRAERRPARVAPDAAESTIRTVGIHLLNSGRSAAANAGWSVEFAPRNGPA